MNRQKIELGKRVKCIFSVGGFLGNSGDVRGWGIITLITSSLVYVTNPHTGAKAIVLKNDEFDEHFLVEE